MKGTTITTYLAPTKLIGLTLAGILVFGVLYKFGTIDWIKKKIDEMGQP